MSVSPTSTSAKVFEANWKLNGASSVAFWSAIGLATVGASLALATVSTNWSSTKAAEPSVARTVIVTGPTSAFAGVPLKVLVAASKLSQAGRPEAV